MNTTHDHRFSELRSLLHHPPSERVWEVLCAQLDLWPHDALVDIALPYASGILARWPQDLRRAAPTGWVNDWTEGLEPPQMCLPNTLSLRVCGIDDHACPRLAQLRPAPPLRYIDLRDNLIGERGLEHLLAAPWLGQPAELLVSGNPIGAEGFDLLWRWAASQATPVSLDVVNPADIQYATPLHIDQAPGRRGWLDDKLDTARALWRIFKRL